MRQGQQNRRGRGRGGRKPQNPLARNYESNGPDVKIRGTAAHIAEKYMSLARDALASGDMVTAESYLQHAEHYNRIIMAAQQQMAPQHGGHQGEGPNGGYRQPARFNAEGTALPEFERALKLDDSVIRYLISVHEHELGAPPMTEEQLAARRRADDDDDDEE